MGKTATSASILLSVDDRFSFFVNGFLVGTSPTTPNNWKNPHVYNVTLADTVNVFAVRGINLPDVNVGGPSSAGVLAAIQITFSDGSTSLISTESGWHATKDIPDGFELSTFDDSQWVLASTLFKYGEGPWESNVVLPTGAVPITTLVAATQVTSPTSIKPAVPTATGAAASNPAPPIGAIVGGVVGGIIFLLLIALVFLWRKRKRNSIHPHNISFISQSPTFEMENRNHFLPSSQVERVPYQSIGTGSAHQYSSSLASSIYSSAVNPSISMSQIGQQNDESKIRDRIERLEGLVLGPDREIALRDGGPRERLAEPPQGTITDPFSGGEPYNDKTNNVSPPAYEV